jgi:hypothetical protein
MQMEWKKEKKKRETCLPNFRIDFPSYVLPLERIQQNQLSLLVMLRREVEDLARLKAFSRIEVDAEGVDIEFDLGRGGVGYKMRN